MSVELSPETIEAIAQRTADIIRSTPADTNPLLTQAMAAKYLNVSLTSFWMMRRAHPGLLMPSCARPLRWSRNALEVFKMSRAMPAANRPGRKPKDLAA